MASSRFLPCKKVLCLCNSCFKTRPVTHQQLKVFDRKARQHIGNLLGILGSLHLTDELEEDCACLILVLWVANVNSWQYPRALAKVLLFDG